MQLGPLADLVLGGDPLTRSLLAAQGAEHVAAAVHAPAPSRGRPAGHARDGRRAARASRRADVHPLRAADRRRRLRRHQRRPGQPRALGQDPGRQDRQLPDHHAHRLERLAARQHRPARALGGELRRARDRGSRQPRRAVPRGALARRVPRLHGPRRERARRGAAVHVRDDRAPAAVHVVCLGNPWHGDDGFGRHVFRRLRQRDDLPAGGRAVRRGDRRPRRPAAGSTAAPRRSSWTRCESARPSAPSTASLPSDLEPPGDELSLHELGLSSLLAALRGGLERRRPKSS